MKPATKKKVILPAVIAGIMSGISAGVFLALFHDLPQIQALDTYRPPSITRIYSSDNHLLTEVYAERRDPVPLSRIPEPLIQGLLATEDRNFYQHSGIAVKGILRAAVRNAVKGRYAEGASTLTQQLAKTLFLTPHKSLTRKLREAILALQVERRYTKDEILTLYLNQIYLGSGAYGVSEASRRYFHKNVEALTIAECALLAGLPKAPSRYSPLNNPELALGRRNIVLAQMKTVGAIDDTVYQLAIAEPVAVGSSSGGEQPQEASYFISTVTNELEAAVGTNMVYKGGLTVHTTLRYELQTSAETAIREGLEALERRQVAEGIDAPSPQAALVALDVSSGAVLAMVGGRHNAQNGFNRAFVRRQPGSAFKPLVYAAAIEQGWEQTDTLLDAPALFRRNNQNPEWQPQNYSRTYEGEICLRWALMHSKNIPAVRIAEKIGPSTIVNFAKRMGITDDLKPDLALALGAYEVTLLQLTNAYGVFVNQGEYAEAHCLTEALDSEGNPIWQGRFDRHIAMSRTGAAIITDMLAAVVEAGTARQARELPGPLAGKTGTTNACKDAWFIGFSPSIICGVWVGTDDNVTLGPLETGSRAALPIWMTFMHAAFKYQQRQQYFDLPDGIVKTYIDPKTGRHTAHDTPGAAEALVRN